MTQTALIMGHSGRAGRHIGAALEARGWLVRGFRRGEDNLDETAKGVDVIVFAQNPPYSKWETQAREALDGAIKAAEASGAALFFPGNVYVYGDAPAPWGSDMPKAAVNSLGQIRIEMEAALERSSAQTIILTAGDFIDTRASGNWFDAVITKDLGCGKFAYPGPLDCPHSWAFLPDYAKAAADVIEGRAELAAHSAHDFAGYTLTGRELGEAVARATKRRLDIREMRWASMYLAAPFWPMARKLIEMRYLWSTPHRLEDRAAFAVTPLDEALGLALANSIAQTKWAQHLAEPIA